jgi:hypothetical protein
MRITFEESINDKYLSKKVMQQSVLDFMKQKGFISSFIDGDIKFKAIPPHSLRSSRNNEDHWKFIRSGKCDIYIQDQIVILIWNINMGTPIFTSFLFGFFAYIGIYINIENVGVSTIALIGIALFFLIGFRITAYLKFKNYSKQLLNSIKYSNSEHRI